MYKAIFKLKTITPLFMYGADGKTPEIRASEFKGMMRFWWRASRYESDIKTLFQEEQKIFGGSDEKFGKSKFSLKITFNKNIESKILWDLIEFEEKKNKKGKKYKVPKDGASGIFYLLYSTVLPGYERLLIEPDEEFTLKISSFDKKSFYNAVASFWLSIYLGGFGERARRGGGNLCVLEHSIKENENDINDDTLPSFNTKGYDNLSNFLTENIKKAVKIINDGKEIKNFIHSYSNIFFLRAIFSKKTFDPNSWKEALNDIGEEFSDYRGNVKNQIFDSAVFGLPVKHRNKKTTITNTIKDSDRRASPIIIKLINFNDKLHWIVLRLQGEFLPEKEKILSIKKEFNKNEKPKITKKFKSPNYKLIDDFWNKLRSNNDEHILLMPERLKNIIEELRKNGAKKIILFGSSARGDRKEKSDIDIAVEGGNSFDDLNGNYDIVYFSEINDEFKEKIKKEGVIIDDE